MFLQLAIFIAVISFVWALWGLKSLSAKEELKHAKEKLKKNRVVYQRTSSK